MLRARMCVCVCACVMHFVCLHFVQNPYILLIVRYTSQAIWTFDSTAIVFTAFPVEPRRLGVRFYNTRKSRIGLLPAPTFLTPTPPQPPRQGLSTSASTPVPITDCIRWLSAEEDWSARNPKISPDGSKIIYVVSANSTAHFSCSKLVCAAWPKGPTSSIGVLETRTVLDVVHVPSSASGFPGLFLAAEQLPRRVWLGDSRRLVLHTDWRSRRELIVVDTDAQGTAAFQRLRLDEKELDVSFSAPPRTTKKTKKTKKTSLVLYTPTQNTPHPH
jgi:hypothetical protein